MRHIPCVDFCLLLPLGPAFPSFPDTSMVNAAEEDVEAMAEAEEDGEREENDFDKDKPDAAFLAASSAFRLRSHALTAERSDESEPKVESSIRLYGLISAVSSSVTAMDFPT